MASNGSHGVVCTCVQAVVVELRLSMEFRRFSSAFKQSLQMQLARSFAVNTSQVLIPSIRPGSVIVLAAVLPPAPTALFPHATLDQFSTILEAALAQSANVSSGTAGGDGGASQGASRAEPLGLRGFGRVEVLGYWIPGDNRPAPGTSNGTNEQPASNSKNKTIAIAVGVGVPVLLLLLLGIALCLLLRSSFSCHNPLWSLLRCCGAGRTHKGGADSSCCGLWRMGCGSSWWEGSCWGGWGGRVGHFAEGEKGKEKDETVGGRKGMVNGKSFTAEAPTYFWELKLRHHHKDHHTPVPPQDPCALSSRAAGESSVREFSLQELWAATDGFALSARIQEGPFGPLYSGRLADGSPVAVARLDPSPQGGWSEEQVRQAALQLAPLLHGNLVPLRGFSVEGGERLLVLDDFCWRAGHLGTLACALHHAASSSCSSSALHGRAGDAADGGGGSEIGSSGSTCFLSWDARVEIAIGCAHALRYLHDDCCPPVVHGAISSSLIFLDAHSLPHIAHAGLAPLHGATVASYAHTDQLVGAFAYSAPEHAMTGVFTPASDVYSFGVVLLELLTGRKPVDPSKPKSQSSLVRWAAPRLASASGLSSLMDACMPGHPPSSTALLHFAKLASHCIQPEPKFRPTMARVIAEICGSVHTAVRSAPPLPSLPPNRSARGVSRTGRRAGGREERRASSAGREDDGEDGTMTRASTLNSIQY
ncbi:hypothetical protein CLOM_g6689 [Closterium sp. NIES-68]|nr:hypothetical protein CLOM_g6689 [Closterium sp. NIES-68]